MIRVFVGFVVALAVGLTGIGAGSFTVPALLLLVGLPPVEAVGTAFVFAAAMRLLAAPFYLVRQQVHRRYLRLLLLGALPGLAVGIYALRSLARFSSPSLVDLLLGVLLAASSAITFFRRAQNPGFASKNTRWLPWLAFPIGIEAGFSSAGAGALGSVLLLNYSELSPRQVIGIDLAFGLVLALIGAAAHWAAGTINSLVLVQLLAGGVPGVIVGCLLARRLPARKWKTVVAAVALFAGLQLIWSGAQSLSVKHATRLATSRSATPPADTRPLMK